VFWGGGRTMLQKGAGRRFAQKAANFILSKGKRVVSYSDCQQEKKRLERK